MLSTARLMILLQCLVPAAAFAESAFSGNKVDDLFTVKSVASTTAIAEGKPKNLKEGDELYFVRSPYKFTITSVKGNLVTVSLPAEHDLAAGQTLTRNPNAQMKKNIETENRLKQALED